MTRMRISLLLGALALALSGLSLPASAAGEKVRFEDAAGDAIGTAALDIVAASIEVKPMAPKATPSVVVTWELADVPQATAATYTFEGELGGCGIFQASFRQGTVYNLVFGEVAGFGISTHQMHVGCGSPPDETGSTATFVELMTNVKDNTITMWTAVANLPKEARSGEITGLRAYSQLSEPVFGIIGNGSLELEPNDEVTTPKSWSF